MSPCVHFYYVNVPYLLEKVFPESWTRVKNCQHCPASALLFLFLYGGIQVLCEKSKAIAARCRGVSSAPTTELLRFTRQRCFVRVVWHSVPTCSSAGSLRRRSTKKFQDRAACRRTFATATASERPFQGGRAYRDSMAGWQSPASVGSESCAARRAGSARRRSGADSEKGEPPVELAAAGRKSRWCDTVTHS